MYIFPELKKNQQQKKPTKLVAEVMLLGPNYAYICC